MTDQVITNHDLCKDCGLCCESFSLAGDSPQDERTEKWVWADIFEVGYNDEPKSRYSCIFFDPEKRQCLDYDNRPSVCSEYPSYKVGEKKDSAESNCPLYAELMTQAAA